MGEGTEFSFQTFTLYGRLSEALPEVILRAVSASVTAVTYNWDGHFLVLLIVGEDFFETLSERVEFAVTDGSCLKHAWLDLRHVQVARVYAPCTLPVFLVLEEISICL